MRSVPMKKPDPDHERVSVGLAVAQRPPARRPPGLWRVGIWWPTLIGVAMMVGMGRNFVRQNLMT
jgi:di/tricarboxylate transporter